MTRLRIVGALGFAILLFVVFLAWTPQVEAYDRYNSGCNACHGVFTGGTSPKGTTFPGNDKHQMHRASGSMNTDCNLCHTSGDNRNPFTNSSDGTANTPGLGCTGCHEKFGLRRHHNLNGISDCITCHDADLTPSPESAAPPYFGSVDTLANSPCNPTAQSNLNENWSLGDFLGLDNDGDNLYDTADGDCLAAGTPGEASGSLQNPLVVTSFDAATGQITISYAPACGATGHHIEIGALSYAALSSYSWSSRICGIGNSGTAAFNPGTGSYFFLVVGNNGASEGSYGTSSTGVERPESIGSVGCPNIPQSLTNRCD